MKTFSEIFCAAHHCDPDAFTHRVFWRGLHRRSIVVAPLVRCFFPGHFAPDWEFIRAAARCDSFRQLEEELRNFTLDSVNLGWWRRVAKLRLSTRRIRQLARTYFIAAAGAPILSSNALPS